jgi:hypothetical protein
MALLATLPEGFSSSFARAVAVSLKSLYATRFSDIPTETLAGQVQESIPALFPQTLSLVRTRPDYHSVLAQLMTEVQRSAAWADADISATGQMILRAVAADVDYGQFSIARALQECFPDTAQSDNSIFLAARMLGNNLRRNISASVNVTLSRAETGTVLSIDPYQEWVIKYSDAILYFFNRNTITFNSSEISIPIELFSGKPMSTTINSSGVPFQRIEIGSENRKISDTDIRVFVNGVQWLQTTEPLWHFQGQDKVFFASTLPNGNVEIRFGNGLNGSSPQLNVPIVVHWIESGGTADNRTEIGAKVTTPITSLSGYGSLVGITTSIADSGSDYLPAKYFKYFGGATRAAAKRAVRRSDYRVKALEFGEPIKDAQFRGQAEIAPRRPAYMNVIEATLLADPPLTDTQWNEFSSYIRRNGIFQTELRRRDPIALPLDIVATVYCRPEANLTDVAKVIRNRVVEALAPTYDSLGYSWYLSDISMLLEGYDELGGLVEYAMLSAPTAPVICPDAQKWVRFNSLNLSMAYTTRGTFAGRKDRAALSVLFDSSGLIVD